MLRVSLWVCGFTIALFSAQTRADDSETIADVRCLAAASWLLANAADATQRQAGTMTTIYYLGRLDGRAPTLDIEDQLVKQVQSMTPADMRSELVRCGGIMTARGQELQRIGKDMVERGK